MMEDVVRSTPSNPDAIDDFVHLGHEAVAATAIRSHPAHRVQHAHLRIARSAAVTADSLGPTLIMTWRAPRRNRARRQTHP